MADSQGEPLLVLVDEKQKERGVKIEDAEANREHIMTVNCGGNASFFNTCFNGLNALLGVGILSTPYALASGGWWSFLLLFVMAFSTFHTALLIQSCMDAHPHINTYPDIGYHAFGDIGRRLVSFFMYSELYLVATSFMILEGDNLSNLLPHFKMEMAGLDGKQSFVILVALIVLPSVWLDNLSVLAYISACGILSSAIILCSVCYVGASDGVGFNEKGSQGPPDWKGIPTAISLYAFCYCAHPVFPTLYNSMKNKRQFLNVMIVCFSCSTLFYAAMAVLGYLMFGSKVSSQITLNLPTEKLSAKLAIFTSLINPISKYALMITPIKNAVKCWFPCSHNNNRSLRVLIGTTLVASSVIVALVLPFFGYMMSLVGAFLSVMGSIILPCLCYLKISGVYRNMSCELVATSFIIFLGFGVMIFGTLTSLLQIIGEL